MAMKRAAGGNAQVQSPTYSKYDGGLNIRDFWHTIADNELTIANNIRLDEGGVVRRRGGWTKLSSSEVGTAGNLIGITQAAFLLAGTLTRILLATDGVTVWSGTGGAWTNRTGAVVNTAATNSLISFLCFNNTVIGYGGTSTPWSWDGSAASISVLGGAPPIGNIGIVWQNRVFFAGVGTARTRLYYSDIGNAGVWGASSYVDVPSPYDGDEITGLAILYGNLIVFKRHSIYIIQGDAPESWVISKTNSAVGCVSPYSIVGVDNLVYFVSDKGLYAMNLSNSKQVCYKVEPRYNAAVTNQLAGSLVRNRIFGAHYRYRNEIWMAVDSTAAGQDQHSRVLAHNYNVVDKNGDPAVSEHITAGVSTAPSVMADYMTGGAGSILPIASFYDKYVYVFSDTATTDAAATGSATNIALSFMSGYRDFGDSEATKTLRNVWTNISFAAGTPKITIGVLSNDFASETVATLTPAAPSTFYNVKQPAGQIFGSSPQGKYFKYGFTSDDGGTFSFFEISFDIVWNGRRN